MTQEVELSQEGVVSNAKVELHTPLVELELPLSLATYLLLTLTPCYLLLTTYY